jgi:sarcosine oxidase subunit beta
LPARRAIIAPENVEANGAPAAGEGYVVKQTADAVVIGAGIMGCAIAHALAEKGMTDVVVLEKDAIGRGATADAAGGIRQQFSTETNVRLATFSVRVWETYAERFGVEIGLRQQGYLFLLTDPAERPSSRRTWRSSSGWGCRPAG